MKLSRAREPIVVTLILLLAGFFRLFRIDRVPPGMHFDEAFNIFDILRLLQGQFSIFFPANHGREPLFFYMTTVAATIFGDQALTLRLTSAIIGIATVFVVYGFARSLFHSRLIAAFAAFLIAISVWHIYYSRMGLRVILSVPLTVLTLWFFWRALSHSLNHPVTPAPRHPGSPSRSYALAGLFASLTVYTYTSGRLLPLVLVALTLSAIVLDRSHWRNYAFGLVVAGAVALIVFVPLGYYFFTHPSDFSTHGSYLSIWDPVVNKGDLAGTFRGNLIAVVGMFLVRGDQEAFRNVPERPVFDPLIGVLFLIGLGLLFMSLVARKSSIEQRLRAILIAASLIAFLSLSVLSDAPPNFTRTLAAVPFAILLPAWALAVVCNRLRSLGLRRIALVGASGILFTSAMFTYNDYFVGFASSPALYYAFNVRMFDVADWVKVNVPKNQIFLAPLWYQDGTLSLMTRTTTLKSFESRDTIVLPGRAEGKDALYAFPVEQESKAAKLAERLGALAVREEVFGSTGEKILVVYRIHSSDLPDAVNPLAALSHAGSFAQPGVPAHSAWDDKFQLLGYSIDAVDAPKRNVEVTLFIQVLKPMQEDYTYSIKVRDSKDRIWGQEDKWLGDNSYASSAASPGDLIIEKFYPGLNPCAPSGDYHVSLEAYNPQTSQVLALTEPQGSAASLGTWRVEASLGNLYDNLEPDQNSEIDIDSQMHVFGYTLTPGDVRPGDEFSLSIFWRGQGNGVAARPVSIRVGDTRLAEANVSLPADGRGICTLLDMRAPASLPSGAASIFVNDRKLTTLNVQR